MLSMEAVTKRRLESLEAEIEAVISIIFRSCPPKVFDVDLSLKILPDGLYHQCFLASHL